MLTPQDSYPELTKSLGLTSEKAQIFFKREDLHPYGSHKGRSIPLMIDHYIGEGFKHFALSSSGNAAFAAAMHIKKINFERGNNGSEKIVLEILTGKGINSHKLEKLQGLKDENILVSLQDRPLQALNMKIQDESIKSLRQSTDDLALKGYESLGQELLEIPNLQAIFMGTSSGTTLQSLAEFFKSKGKKVELHLVQTSSCHPLADTFVDNEKDEKSIADAIIDHSANRSEKLIPLIEASQGSGWIASNDQIIAAQDLAKKNANLSISTNSALSLAGLMQATYTGKKWNGSVVCMICGD